MTQRNPPADMTLADVRRFAKMYGLKVETNAPGDGKRRFAFYEANAPHARTLGFALGIREAELWLRGFMAGADYATPRDENPRRHPGYKGVGIEFPEDRFAYRGYSVQLGSDKEWWYISKGGQHIGSAATAEKAREIIADLTADTYRGER